MEKLLKELADSKLVRITGSFADGSQTENSDIDFYVKPDSNLYQIPIGQGKRNIEKIMAIVEKYDLKFRSTMPGYIFTHLTAGNGHLERQMEFSDLFSPRKNRKKEVEIQGIKFKTY